jgi:hypothetical protein
MKSLRIILAVAALASAPLATMETASAHIGCHFLRDCVRPHPIPICVRWVHFGWDAHRCVRWEYLL